MIGHVRAITKRRVSDFILSEDGRIGSKNALAVSAIVSASALAAMLLAPRSAFAEECNGVGQHWCDDKCCFSNEQCCHDIDEACCVATAGGCPTNCWLDLVILHSEKSLPARGVLLAGSAK